VILDVVAIEVLEELFVPLVHNLVVLAALHEFPQQVFIAFAAQAGEHAFGEVATDLL
jgi:hypothetical protein